MVSNKKLNRRKILQSVPASVAFLAMPAVWSSARAASEYTLTFGHTFGKATEGVMITGLDVFKAKAEEYTDGKLLVDIHEAGSLGGQTVLPQKVLTGAIQGCQLSTQNFTPFAEVYNLLDFPHMFPSNASFEKAINSDAFKSSGFFEQPRAKGFEVLPGMWANAGYRVLGFSKKLGKTIKTPADLDGVKIRVTGSKVEQQVFKLLLQTRSQLLGERPIKPCNKGRPTPSMLVSAHLRQLRYMRPLVQPRWHKSISTVISQC